MRYGGKIKTSVSNRFKSELKAGMVIEVVRTIHLMNGVGAFREEQKILKDNVKYKYKGEKVLLYGGDSELFTKDVLQLDSRIQQGGVPSM